MPNHAVLIGQLKQLLDDLEQIVVRTQILVQKYQITPSE